MMMEMCGYLQARKATQLPNDYGGGCNEVDKISYPLRELNHVARSLVS